MDKFAVGEVVEGHSFMCDTYLNGMFGEIVGPLEFRGGWCAAGPVTWDTFEVKFANGETVRANPANLRKRPPDADELAAWTAALDCIDRWKLPMRVPA